MFDEAVKHLPAGNEPGQQVARPQFDPVETTKAFVAAASLYLSGDELGAREILVPHIRPEGMAVLFGMFCQAIVGCGAALGKTPGKVLQDIGLGVAQFEMSQELHPSNEPDDSGPPYLHDF